MGITSPKSTGLVHYHQHHLLYDLCKEPQLHLWNRKWEEWMKLTYSTWWCSLELKCKYLAWGWSRTLRVDQEDGGRGRRRAEGRIQIDKTDAGFLWCTMCRDVRGWTGGKNWLRENGRMHGSVVGAWVAGCEGGSGMEYYSIPKGCVCLYIYIYIYIYIYGYFWNCKENIWSRGLDCELCGISSCLTIHSVSQVLFVLIRIIYHLFKMLLLKIMLRYTR
jgi:hypothetical protein